MRRIKSTKLEMKKERLQQTMQKYKGLEKTIMNNYMALKWKPGRNRFLEKFNLPRLNQEGLEIMNSPVTSTEIKAVIKNLPKKQKPRTRWLHRSILSNIKCLSF